MKKIIITLITICSLFFLTSCFKKNNRGVIPPNTAASVNIVGSPGEKARIEVIGRDGNSVKPTPYETRNSKKAMTAQTGTDGTQNDRSISITLREGSCIVEICYPSNICESFIVDPINDCPAEF